MIRPTCAPLPQAVTSHSGCVHGVGDGSRLEEALSLCGSALCVSSSCSDWLLLALAAGSSQELRTPQAEPSCSPVRAALAPTSHPSLGYGAIESRLLGLCQPCQVLPPPHYPSCVHHLP